MLVTCAAQERWGAGLLHPRSWIHRRHGSAVHGDRELAPRQGPGPGRPIPVFDVIESVSSCSSVKRRQYTTPRIVGIKQMTDAGHRSLPALDVWISSELAF